MPIDKIVIKGAREHNLKNIDLELPRDKLIVMTGLSGSGKSSLAFDTIYADGQRRYVESLSSYARMFLGQMDKPDVDSIEGLSPAISIDQKTTSKNPRSTVGTVTEIYDYFRLLFARIGVPHCPVCGREIKQQTVDQIVDKISSLPQGTKIQILAPVVRGRKGEHTKELEAAGKSGYVRVRIDGIVYDLSEEIKLEKNKKHTIEIVVDRLVVKPEMGTRLADSIETAAGISGGIVICSVVDGEDIMPDLIHDDGAYAHTDLRFFEKDLVLNRGCVPNEYLYYFYYRERAVANVLSSPQTRGELIEEINREMTSELASIDIENDFEKGLACFEKWYGIRENNYMANETGIHRDKPWTFDVYGKDAGGYAGVALRFMDIARSGKTQQMILCTPNNGAIPGLLDTDVIESTCDISTDGCVPHRVEADSVPAGNLELIRRVKYYERTVARGIVNRSKRDIVESLAMHPLVNSYSLAKDIAAQYFELNRDYIDGWTD